jgi:adenylate cyclase
MPMKNTLLLIIAVSLIGLKGFSQEERVVDSLKNRLVELHYSKTGSTPADQKDTLIIHTLNLLSEAYWASDPYQAIDYAQQTLALSKKLEYPLGIGSAYHSLGSVYTDMSDYDKALEFFTESLKIRMEMGNPKNIGATYLNIGTVYWRKGNYAEALKMYLLALRNFESIGDSGNVGGCLLNIGILSAQQGNHEEALVNFEAALDKFKKSGNNHGVSAVYGSMGALYGETGQLKKAIHYDSLALKSNQETGDKMGIANSFNNLAYDYEQLGDNDKARNNYLKALELNQEIGNKDAQAMNLTNLGSLYARENKFAVAKRYFTSSLALAQEIGSYMNIADSYRNLSSADSALGNYGQALGHYKNYVVARDSMFNAENTKKVTQLSMQYEFDKKEASSKAEQDKMNAIAAEELQKQKLIRNSVGGGLLVVILFSVVVFRQRNKISKEKKKSDDLLLNILPAEVAEELKAKGSAEAKLLDEVTVLFTDFKGFTQLSEKLSPKELVAEINECFSTFDNIMQKHGVEKIKTIGDAYMAAGGLPTSNTTHANDVVKAALDIQQSMREHKAKKEAAGKIFFDIRIGVHTGPVVAGIVGVKKFAYDIWGDTVNIASRMESSGEAGKVNISGATYELVKSNYRCVHRGKVQAKGKGDIDMYFVEG